VLRAAMPFIHVQSTDNDLHR